MKTERPDSMCVCVRECVYVCVCLHTSEYVTREPCTHTVAHTNPCMRRPVPERCCQSAPGWMCDASESPPTRRLRLVPLRTVSCGFSFRATEAELDRSFKLLSRLVSPVSKGMGLLSGCLHYILFLLHCIFSPLQCRSQLLLFLL